MKFERKRKKKDRNEIPSYTKPRRKTARRKGKKETERSRDRQAGRDSVIYSSHTVKMHTQIQFVADKKSHMHKRLTEYNTYVQIVHVYETIDENTHGTHSVWRFMDVCVCVWMLRGVSCSLHFHFIHFLHTYTLKETLALTHSLTRIHARVNLYCVSPSSFFVRCVSSFSSSSFCSCGYTSECLCICVLHLLVIASSFTLNQHFHRLAVYVCVFAYMLHITHKLKLYWRSRKQWEFWKVFRTNAHTHMYSFYNRSYFYIYVRCTYVCMCWYIVCYARSTGKNI